MKIYAFGQENLPVLLLLPGTCCDWKGNFGQVIPLLEKHFRVLCVSYDGFDASESTRFSTMLDETEKMEEYVRQNCGGRIHAAYGCSLGGSFVGLMIARGNIHMDVGILGGSDLDQSGPVAAWLMTALFMPMIYPLIRDGKFSSRFFRRRMEKQAAQMPEYTQAFLRMFGGARPYVSLQSCKKQFYSDLVTPLPDHIQAEGTRVHIFYAQKMGAKYLKRYRQHFADPVIHTQPLQHEELLACYPEKWADLVQKICLGEEILANSY